MDKDWLHYVPELCWLVGFWDRCDTSKVTENELLVGEAREMHCQSAAATVEGPGPASSYKWSEYWKLIAPIARRFSMLLPMKLNANVQYLAALLKNRWYLCVTLQGQYYKIRNAIASHGRWRWCDWNGFSVFCLKLILSDIHEIKCNYS